MMSIDNLSFYVRQRDLLKRQRDSLVSFKVGVSIDIESVLLLCLREHVEGF